MYAGGAFSAFACHGRHAMRAPAQAACRQPAQLNTPLVLNMAATSTRVVNYSSNFLLVKYSLMSISGCKFPFTVAIFCSQLTFSPQSVQRVAPAGRKPQNRPLRCLNTGVLRFAQCCCYNSIDADPPVHHLFFVIGSLY